MATTPEGAVKRKVIKALKELKATHGLHYYMPVSGGYSRSGEADFLVCLCGRWISIETKAGKGKTTLLQDMNLESVRKAGGITMIVREEDVLSIDAFTQRLLEAVK